jgi:hypothetical protein
MSQFCGICGSTYVCYDTFLGLNVCGACWAHETAEGWQVREQIKETLPGSLTAKQLTQRFTEWFGH